MKTLLPFLAFLTFALSFQMKAQFINGDFQIPASTSLGNCHAGTNWTVATSGTSIPQYVTTFTNSWIDITPCNSFGNGAYLEQTISTVSGTKYYIMLDLATCYGWQIWDSGLNIYINGSPLNVGTNRLYNDTFDTSSSGALLWRTLTSNTFMATGNSATVKIEGNGANPLNPNYMGTNAPGVMGLDNVVLKQLSGEITGIQNQMNLPEIKIFPNPADGIVRFQLDDPSVTGIFSLYDLEGKKIIEAPSSNEVDVSEFPNGIYLVKFKGENRVINKKLTILH